MDIQRNEKISSDVPCYIWRCDLLQISTKIEANGHPVFDFVCMIYYFKWSLNNLEFKKSQLGSGAAIPVDIEEDLDYFPVIQGGVINCSATLIIPSNRPWDRLTSFPCGEVPSFPYFQHLWYE